MDLKDFIHQTLSEIGQGIDAVNRESGPLQVSISDRNTNNKSPEVLAKAGIAQTGQGERFASSVSFDMALTVEGSEKSKGGLVVALAAIAMGTGTEQAQAQHNVSRIQFSLPVIIDPNHRSRSARSSDT